MPNQNEEAWSGISDSGRNGLFGRAFSLAGRALEAETDRWFLWLPVLFAAGILTYFALPTEPDLRIPAALVLAAMDCGSWCGMHRLDLR